MLLIPIRTETSVRLAPAANYALIVANVAAYFVFDFHQSRQLEFMKHFHLALHSDWPRLHQFISYQFLHGDLWHLGGNMLFLWVFGSPVNGKMGHLPYVLFYLAGGIFSGYVFALYSASPLIGASGAVAAVTTAYLVLFPRSRITVMYFFILIGFFELPAMILIIFKMILWDNLIAPGIGPASNVAHSAHLGGYLFGFLATMLMLLGRALPRDMFDMLALWKRWNQRRTFATAMSDPAAQARAQYGSVAQTQPVSREEMDAQSERMDRVTDLRSRIMTNLARGEPGAAAALYEQLISLESDQYLPERHQLQVAREFYQTGRYAQAAAAFERFLQRYGSTPDAPDIALLLGIIYARELGQHETARRYLESALEKFPPGPRRDQCVQWLEKLR